MTDQLPPGTHTFNDVNETQDPGYTYDANGNLTSDGVKDYFWDATNRLIAVQTKDITSGLTNLLPGISVSPTPPPLPSPTVSPPPELAPPSAKPPTITLPPIVQAPAAPVLARSEFSYDGLGRRVRITEKQVSNLDEQGNPIWTTVSDHGYVWSGNTLAEERDTTGASVTRRFFAEGEQINGANYFFTRDHLGSIREMTDATGTLRAQYEYDPYGVRTKLSGDLDADFGFTGHWHHGPSRLNLSLYRAYSPMLGRWLNRDPIGEVGGTNLYTYVHNNSVNLWDPLGLKDILIGIAPLYYTPAQLAEVNRITRDYITPQDIEDSNKSDAATVQRRINEFLKASPLDPGDKVEFGNITSEENLSTQCRKYDQILLFAHGNIVPGEPYVVALGLDRVPLSRLPKNCTPFGCSPQGGRTGTDVVDAMLRTLKTALGK
jgi:RHS repeat-associated protein